MKIKVQRAFSRTIQYRPFEPVNAYCSAEMEWETEQIGLTIEEVLKSSSSELDTFVRNEVAKTLAIVRPPIVPTDVKVDLKAAKKKAKDLSEESIDIEINED